jgi:hypothetical protein
MSGNKAAVMRTSFKFHFLALVVLLLAISHVSAAPTETSPVRRDRDLLVEPLQK